MKRYDQLEITDSFMFAKVMSDKEICKATLEQILNIKIRDIKYLIMRKPFRWHREQRSKTGHLCGR